MRSVWLRAFAVAACGLCWFGASAAPALANTYIVANADDSGPGSLREAITSANANPGLDMIAFAIGTGAQTISPTSALPTFTDPIVIDGTSQPGFAGTPLIQLDGGSIPESAGPTDGLLITAGSSTVRGLEITSWSNRGIELQTGGSNLIAGNYIGTDGSNALGNGAAIYDLAKGTGAAGVIIDGGSTNNTIGGTIISDRNLVSDNGKGIVIAGSGATGNLVEGNYIGTNAAGTGAIGNERDGVLIVNGASNNTVGGTVTGAGNLISGNGQAGVDVTTSGANTIAGNFIGTNAAGTLPVGNGKGVGLGDGSPNNVVGGTTVSARNVISGNVNRGVVIGASGSSGNLLEGNFIGTDPSGSKAVPNGRDGVLIFNTATNNTVGGTTTGAANLISGNKYDGVYIFGAGTSGNLVEGNYIGTNAAQTGAIGNAGGVLVAGNATGNTIGGTAGGAGNTIAFNAGLGGVNDFNVAYTGGVGVQVEGASTTGDPVLSNSIFANGSAVGIVLTNGGNANQSAPTVKSVRNSGSRTLISGTVTGNSPRVEVFGNASCGDPEGKKLLGTASVQRSSWSLYVPRLASGQGVTATTTDSSTSNTSRFSACKRS